jgi:hypothetical protein
VTGSGTAFLQQVIDDQVLLNQSQAAPQGMSRLLGRQALKSTVADAIVLAEVAVDGLQAVVRLTSDDVGLLPFGVALPTNDALMSESCSHIVERGAARHEGVAGTLVLGQHPSDLAVVGIEQLGEIAVGEESPLLVSLLAQAEGLAQQPLASRQAVDAPLGVLGRGEVEENGDQLGVGDPLAMGGWVVDADGHPQGLAVHQVILGTHVLGYDF